MARELSLEDLLDVYHNCMKKNNSRCNDCILNDEFGDACFEIKDVNSVKYLKELKKIKESQRFKKNQNNYIPKEEVTTHE